MSESRSYVCPRHKYETFIASLQNWLSGEEYDSIVSMSPDGARLLKVERRGRWRKFVGMSTALTIAFRPAGENLHVEIGAARVTDKIIIAIIGLFIFLWPLTLTASYGAWEQYKLPQRVFDQIGLLLGQ
jgi:hypothetical protein